MGHNPPVPLPLSPAQFCLTHRSTTELVCTTCEPARYIIVDQILLLDEWGDGFTLEHYDPHEVPALRRAAEEGRRNGHRRHAVHPQDAQTDRRRR